MKPMFFGDSKRKLYGVYDAPTGNKRRSHAVLLCYPGVQEYSTSLWGFRRLSAMLAQAGHHVLRFDYFGTGDSAGRVEEGAVDTWIADIQQAALELKDISGARQLSILGKRLGGALAVKACQAGLDAKRLVLWDPVVHGSAYVSELETWDTRRNLLLLHAERRGNGASELLGYPFPLTQRQQLQSLNLVGELPGSLRNVAIFASEPRDGYKRLHEAYVNAGLSSELLQAADAAEGGQAGAQGRAQLSGSILADMANKLEDTSAA